MSQASWEAFHHLWICDTEFLAPPGEIPTPICLVAYDLVSGRCVKQWLEGVPAPDPFYGDRSLVAAYQASAEMGTFLSLGWGRPAHILDPYVEFLLMKNGLVDLKESSLLAACLVFGIDGGDAALKETMRQRILEGPPYSKEDQQKILDYCETDVILTTRLFKKMKPGIDLPRALLRGRFAWTVAKIERAGIPVDTEALAVLQKHWDRLKPALIRKIDPQFGVYEGTTFKIRKFQEYLVKKGIEWETTPSGLPRLDDEFFKDQAKTHPELEPLRELRYTLGKLRLNSLTIGHDGRNRYSLMAFRSKTSRNQPSNAKAIFGPAVWIRNLIRPTPGRALAYIDYSQQEFGIGAWLSRDPNMIAAYESGDPYLTFAKQAGAVPPEGTKHTHPNERELFKTYTHGLNYGMGLQASAKRINQPLAKARELNRFHRETYSKYWQWLESTIDRAKLSGKIRTVYGWALATSKQEHRTLQNFPMQATGAEILRVALMLCEQAGITVCAPIHDAILIESSEEAIEKDAARVIRLMGDASYWVLGGFRLRAEAKIITHQERLDDPRGTKMWGMIWEVVRELESG